MADPKAEVLVANRTFYEIFRLGDFLRMDEMWSHLEEVSVYHPEWAGLDGRDKVMASWYQVLVRSDPPAIYPSSETVILNGSKAIVFCVEQIGTEEIVASNIFTYEAGAWRICHHQATPLPARVS